MTKVITYGTYDLLHYGHIRLAKANSTIKHKVLLLFHKAKAFKLLFG